MPVLRQRLPEGPLDIVGDVHGELSALVTLLGRLGVDLDRLRAERPLVFVGDLVDRGPDSPGVVRLVRALVEAGQAFCVAGNHEVNLLRGLVKEGNGWFRGDASDHYSIVDAEGRALEAPFVSEVAAVGEREGMLDFFASLPLVLEREDLRVVHACWWPDALTALPESGEHAALSDHFEAQVDARLRADGLIAAMRAELRAAAGLKRRAVLPERYPEAHVAVQRARQRGNPVKALTSGVEEAIGPDAAPAFLSGKWRYLRRLDWWQGYHDAPAVVVGHYWRRREQPDPGKPLAWDTALPTDWAGPRGNVFCVDFSVGRRYAERLLRDPPPWRGALAALRWPERTLVFDDRDAPIPTTRWGG